MFLLRHGALFVVFCAEPACFVKKCSSVIVHFCRRTTGCMD